MTAAVSAATEKRLIEWGIWARHTFCDGMGYPNRAVEGRLREEGGVLPTTTAQASVLAHEDAEEIEKFLIELSRLCYEPSQAVQIEYLTDDPIFIKARRLKMSRTTYIKLRDIGLAWIDGRLRACSKQRSSDLFTIVRKDTESL